MKELNLRKSIYLAIANSFDYPSKNIFEISLKNPLLCSLANLKNNFKDFSLSIFYEKFFDLLENMENFDFKDIEENYYRFFLSPSSICPPYASYWIDGYIMGPSFWDIIDEYKKNGFVKSYSYKNLDDFISVEMEYLSNVIDEEEIFFSFLTNHVTKWMFPFFETLLNVEVFAFYKLLGNFTRQFLNEERLRWWEKFSL